MTHKVKINQEDPLIKALIYLSHRADQEDLNVRKRQLRLWKKLDLFWHGIQYILWNENDGLWVSPVDMGFYSNEITTRWDQSEEPDYTSVINIFRAHGESVIAALSAQVPGVRFPPDNAESEDDLITSKVFAKIADLISKHNKAQLMQLAALLRLWNEGLVAAYCYNEADKKYGIHKVPAFEAQPNCPVCQIDGEPQDVDDEDPSPTLPCPNCGSPMSVYYALKGYDEYAKSRTKIEIHGPLSVKVPYYTRCQEEFGYIHLYTEMSQGAIIAMYPELLDDAWSTSMGEDTFERAARTPSAFGSDGQFDSNTKLVTMRRTWFRPQQFYELGASKADEIKQLLKKYPDGVYVCSVGDRVLEVRPENMDKHWRFGKAGLSRFIHSDPVGLPLVEVQELTNTLVNLTQETIEHGIPTTFVDDSILDLGAYGSRVQRPGTITGVSKPANTGSIGDCFFEGTKASLSREVGVQNAYYEKMGQFVVGSFPSIYGGDSKSKTASEYSQSRQMALQRLSITYKLFSHWWADLMDCAVRLFIEGMVDDEQYTEHKEGTYITVWIRQAELRGQVGDVEPEANDSFPISTAAKQALLMKLIELNNELLNAAIFDESNRRLVGDALGFTDLNIPGENQRIKQAREIEQLLKGEMPMPEMDVDEHQIHINQCVNWAVSDVGLETKRLNPIGYEAVIEHLRLHKQMDMALQMQNAMAGQPPAQPNQEQEQDAENQPVA